MCCEEKGKQIEYLRQNNRRERKLLGFPAPDCLHLWETNGKQTIFGLRKTKFRLEFYRLHWRFCYCEVPPYIQLVSGW